MQTAEEHANHTHTQKGRGFDALDQTCCELTMLTTAPELFEYSL